MKVLIFRCGNIKEPEWISWIITEDPVGIWDKEDDCHSGDYMFHFWSTYKHHFRLEQTISKKKLKNDRKPAYQKICRLSVLLKN